MDSPVYCKDTWLLLNLECEIFSDPCLFFLVLVRPGACNIQISVSERELRMHSSALVIQGKDCLDCKCSYSGKAI